METYKFVFLLSLNNKIENIDADSHSEAWTKAYNIIQEKFDGKCRAAYCVTINDNDTGVLDNFKTLFTDDNTDMYYNTLKAKDLVKNN